MLRRCVLSLRLPTAASVVVDAAPKLSSAVSEGVVPPASASKKRAQAAQPSTSMKILRPVGLDPHDPMMRQRDPYFGYAAESEPALILAPLDLD